MFKLPGINSYMGGKAASGTYQRIITRSTAWPTTSGPHDTLEIPFLGNCAVTHAIRWLAKVIANDTLIIGQLKSFFLSSI